MRKYLSILFLMSILTSCISEIPIDNLNLEDQIAVVGLISSDTCSTILIGNYWSFTRNNLSAFQKTYNFSFYEDNQMVFFTYDSTPIIEVPLVPKQKHSFSFKIETDQKSVQATTTMPERVEIEQADIRQSDIIRPNYGNYFEAIIKWSDPPDIKNFYEVQLLGEMDGPVSFFNFYNINDPVLVQEAGLDYNPSSFVFSDVSFPGKQYQVKLLFQTGHRGSYPNMTPDDTWVVLRSISEEYYHYMKSWYKHSFQQNTGTQVDVALENFDYIPLLLKGDPVPLYSNIENGIGIFAGYSEDIKKFNFVR